MGRANFGIFFALLIFLSACDRKIDGPAKISLSLPSGISVDSNKKAVSQSTDDFLVPDHVVINLTGDGVREKVLYSWDRCSDCPEGEKNYPAVFEVGDAENGRSILIQVVAVYKSTATGVMRFFYGNYASSFNSSTIVVDLVSVGSVTNPVQGRVSGRYLTGSDSGPTGTLEMSYDFDESDKFPAMTIETSAIVNGWFSIFGLTGMSFKYTVLETGEVLWNKSVALDSDEFNPSYTPDGGITYPYHKRLIKAFIPLLLETHDGTDYVRDPQMLTWGFWGTEVSNIETKRACVPFIDGINASNVRRYNVLESFASATALVISYSNSAGTPVPTIAELQDSSSDANAYPYIVVDGGVEMTGSCSDLGYALESDKYLNYFKVEQRYFDGANNEELVGFKGIFKFQLVSASYYSSVSVSGIPVTMDFKLLPGVDKVISEIAVFSKAVSADYRIDNPKCDGVEGALAPALVGYAPVLENATFVDITTSLLSSDISSGVFSVVCYKTRANGQKIGTTLNRHDLAPL